MPAPATYQLKNGVALITMDDGAKNVISPKMIRALNKTLDRAEKDKAVVILTGREDVFSAGFDLKVLRQGVTDTFAMLTGGFKLAARLLGHPFPVIIACNGHAVAMGAFLLLSGDYRLCAEGPYKIVANEVAIGLTLPHAAIEICRQRLHPAHFVRAAMLAESYGPESGVAAGFTDRTVPGEKLMEEAVKLAENYTKLDLEAHKHTKLRARKDLLNAMENAIAADRRDFVLKGVKRLMRI